MWCYKWVYEVEIPVLRYGLYFFGSACHSKRSCSARSRSSLLEVLCKGVEGLGLSGVAGRECLRGLGLCFLPYDNFLIAHPRRT